MWLVRGGCQSDHFTAHVISECPLIVGVRRNATERWMASRSPYLFPAEEYRVTASDALPKAVQRFNLLHSTLTDN